MKKLSTTLASAILALSIAPAVQAATTLTPEAEEAILTALDDEYKAQATYAALIEEFGTNTAFTNIMKAEETHADALISLLEKYDVEVPENGYLTGELPLGELPDTLQEAYEAGVIGEINNMALYEEELLPAVEGYTDITRVFTNLMTASETKHLPTFEACAAGGCGDRSVVSSASAAGQGGHGGGKGHGGGAGHGGGKGHGGGAGHGGGKGHGGGAGHGGGKGHGGGGGHGGGKGHGRG